MVKCKDHAHSLLFELGEVCGTDVTAAVTFIPGPPRTVWYLKLIMKEEREGRILEGEKQKGWI